MTLFSNLNFTHKADIEAKLKGSTIHTPQLATVIKSDHDPATCERQKEYAVRICRAVPQSARVRAGTRRRRG